MKIDEMELLIRVAETQSMTVAAQQRHLTPAAVSAAIQRMEESLGLRLFERTTRSVHLTAEGAVVVDGCRAMLNQWSEVLDQARGRKANIEGTLHVSAPADTVYQLLSDVVASLASQHPKIKIVLDTSDTVQQLHKEAIDLAVRYGPLKDSGLTARKLADTPSVLVASPRYLKKFGRPTSPADLSEHRLLTLQLAGAPSLVWELATENERITLDIASPLCGNGYLCRQWALAGEGIALKSLFDVVEDLESGKLVQLLDKWTGPHFPIHAVFPSRRFQTSRVRELFRATAARFAKRAERCDAWLSPAPDVAPE